jgi:cyclopropane-fatty-acyl-phospholipid synthase
MASESQSLNLQTTDAALATAAAAVSTTCPAAVERFAQRLAGHNLPRFEIQLPDGAIHVLGGSPAAVRDDDAEHVRFRLRALNRTGLEAVLSFDEPRAAEAFIDGDLDVDGDFLAALDLRQFFSDRHPFHSLWRFAPALLHGQLKTDAGAIPRHYDYGDDFYFAFLDKDVRLYSQALYRSESETLEQAARNKLEYIVDACRLEAGSRVIDVGAGWGSFATFAAARGVDVTMLTLAARQFEYLQQQANQAGLPGRLRVIRENIYAFEPRERYDAVVLLGVMEHLPDYEKLMARFDGLVKPNGFVYMDFSAIRKKFNISSVVYRHVFPGNHSPVALADLLQAISRSSFEPIALCNDRHSYYLTLRAWALNLEAARGRLVETFGQRTFRLFQLYLWATAHDFGRTGALESYRLVLQKSTGHDSAYVGLRKQEEY